MKTPNAIKRIMAFILDFLIMLAFIAMCMTPVLICTIYALNDSSMINILASSISGIVSGILIVVVLFFYSVILPTNWHGQTLGKRFFMIQIKKTNGQNADYKSMFMRVLLRIFVFVVTLGLSLIVDLITLIFSKDHLTFYDILASTIVVDSSN